MNRFPLLWLQEDQRWRQGRAWGLEPLSEAFRPPSEEIRGYYRKKFGKMAYENFIFSHFSPSSGRFLLPPLQEISGAIPADIFRKCVSPRIGIALLCGPCAVSDDETCLSPRSFVIIALDHVIKD